MREQMFFVYLTLYAPPAGLFWTNFIALPSNLAMLFYFTIQGPSTGFLSELMIHLFPHSGVLIEWMQMMSWVNKFLNSEGQTGKQRNTRIHPAFVKSMSRALHNRMRPFLMEKKDPVKYRHNNITIQLEALDERFNK